MTDSTKKEPEEKTGSVEEPAVNAAGAGNEDVAGENNPDEAPEGSGKTPEQEAAKWKDMALRRQADLENFRKRIERERLESLRYANASLLEELLPVIDNFEMGLEAARAESSESMIFKGMEMVKKQLDDFLETRGVREIETGNLEFDPAVHEAMGQEQSTDVAEGHILRTVRKGYTLNDRLLRAASVIVAAAAAGDADGEDGNGDEPAGEA